MDQRRFAHIHYCIAVAAAEVLASPHVSWRRTAALPEGLRLHQAGLYPEGYQLLLLLH